ncbi:MAG: CoB--CoM heterodisulfide reductase iron-sulfur subunit A family protein [Deltaproteobacteria bacterium]|nr:CoB--CoM heterodisulfide reductase iron-sulfur subunit A family protein [Deltaproteobacteria bacterium]MBW1929645.1 CoB--CoM heterodisulfide reductase iron-sulfur subunit A family protein [Deltaproteobacteria bacterium]MBW2126489.1 CoB--CoM heterodisulfide reductase iron-sulfur subunit A family protein [Deltaproteobacteria bacterium]
MSSEKSIGRVLVIGGGISGIEASLSLSRAGYGVYLVERMSILGGMIPNLHRIYPLCACCKLDPRIASCQQDPNIQIFLNSTIQGISGAKGKFQVDIKEGGEHRTLEVGAIVLAAGIETFDPSQYQTYSYGNYPNVVTSVEYEQMQRPLGPEKGQIKRPSDGKVPQKIAWLQCVGSRDINRCDAPYCSSVCCMYALKEAVNTKEFDEGIETTIFYMDMRTHGKGFEEYLNMACDRGVRLERSRVHTVEATDGDDLLIVYADESGELKKETFNLVILSVGLRPSKDMIDLAQKIGVNLTGQGYISTGPFSQVSTSVPGIFVCGGLLSPADIKDSIIQADAAVSEIASFLKPEPFVSPPSYPPLVESAEPPKPLFAYHICPGTDPNLGEKVKETASKVPGIADVVELSNDISQVLEKKLKETGANRVVFASCSPNIHKPLIELALRASGLNPYLYETVDLRVIGDSGNSSQLEDRIRAGVSRALLLSPAPIKEIEVFKHALVVGGGIAGMQSALAIANEGYPVTLVEREETLGGHAQHVNRNWQGEDIQSYLKDLIEAIKRNENITVLLNAQIKRSLGSAGHFNTTVSQEGKDIDISHGVTILATGGNPIRPKEYLYGEHKNIYLWSELSHKLIEDPSYFQKANCGVFIQCVGSREPNRPYCSNFCCTFTVRTAVDLKETNPDMDIYVLYRDIRTFGEREALYREAREKGVVFVRYDLDNKPIVEAEGPLGKLKVIAMDHILKRPIVIEPDFISLQSAITPENNSEVAEIFGVGMDENGFFAESPEKLKPLDATRPGIFLAGLAHYPKDSGDSIAQAKAAAARALEILRKDTIEVGGTVAEVQPEKCAVCCTCVRTCPFHIPYIDHDRGAAYIDPALCMGCGMCVAECPGKAIVMATCSDQMLNQTSALILGVS